MERIIISSDWLSKIKKNWEIATIGVFIIYGLAALISGFPEIIKENITPNDFYIAVGILSVSSFTAACSSYIFSRRIHDIQCQKCVNDLKINLDIHDLQYQKCVNDLKINLDIIQAIKKLTTDESPLESDVLIPFENMKVIESDENTEEIWISTADLGNDIKNLGDIIFNNIKRKVKYVYFIPKHDKEDLKSELVKLFNKGVIACGRSIDKTDEVLEIIEVPSHFFYLEFVIYTRPTEKIILVLLPQNMKNGEEELYYRVPKEQAKIFIESLSQLKHNICKDINIVDIDRYTQSITKIK